MRLRGCLGKCAQRFGGQAELHASETLGLHVHFEGAATVTLGVADFIPSFRSTAGELAGSAHKILLNSYKNQSIIERLSWQGQGTGS